MTRDSLKNNDNINKLIDTHGNAFLNDFSAMYDTFKVETGVIFDPDNETVDAFIKRQPRRFEYKDTNPLYQYLHNENHPIIFSPYALKKGEFSFCLRQVASAEKTSVLKTLFDELKNISSLNNVIPSVETKEEKFKGNTVLHHSVHFPITDNKTQPISPIDILYELLDLMDEKLSKEPPPKKNDKLPSWFPTLTAHDERTVELGYDLARLRGLRNIYKKEISHSSLKNTIQTALQSKDISLLYTLYAFPLFIDPVFRSQKEARDNIPKLPNLHKNLYASLTASPDKKILHARLSGMHCKLVGPLITQFNMLCSLVETIKEDPSQRGCYFVGSEKVNILSFTLLNMLSLFDKNFSQEKYFDCTGMLKSGFFNIESTRSDKFKPYNTLISDTKNTQAFLTITVGNFVTLFKRASQKNTEITVPTDNDQDHTF